MIIEVKVHANAKKQRIKINDNIVEIWVPEKREKGVANRYLIKYLRKLTGKEVEIISGLTKSHKRVVIHGDTKEIINKIRDKANS